MKLCLKAPLYRIFSGAVLGLLASVFVASAQGTQIKFGGFQSDPTQPVEVTADQLTINQADGSATLSGNVMIIQGSLRLTAAKVIVEYIDSTDDQSTRISNMIASGGVLVVNGEDAAESQDAVYSIDDGTILMTGNVVLTQGAGVVSAEQMTVDLNSGNAQFQGRVKTTLKANGN